MHRMKQWTRENKPRSTRSPAPISVIVTLSLIVGAKRVLPRIVRSPVLVTTRSYLGRCTPMQHWSHELESEQVSHDTLARGGCTRVVRAFIPERKHSVRSVQSVPAVIEIQRTPPPPDLRSELDLFSSALRYRLLHSAIQKQFISRTLSSYN